MESLNDQLKKYDQLLQKYRRVGGKAFDEADQENALISYSFHSNAIEGNTFTYEQTYDFLKTGQVVPGKSYEEHAEHRDLVNGYKLMRDFARDNVPVSEAMMLALHRQVLQGSNPNHAGKYREVAVRVGQDTTPYPAKAKEMMKQMVQDFPAFEKENHPLVAAAKLHLDTVIIHPFRDGNGRTSRLLLDYVLLKDDHPSVLLKVEDKPVYFQAIRESRKQKNLEPFARFVVSQATERLGAKVKLLQPKLDYKELLRAKPKRGETPTDIPQKKKGRHFSIWDWEGEKTTF